MLDIAGVRETYNQRIISKIVLTDRVYNIADPLIKTKYCSPLQQVMTCCHLSHPVGQYVLDLQIELM